MSFFDDDEPPTRAARPRRPAQPATTGTRARATPSSDAQQLMVRRAVALGMGALLILILLVVGVKGCLGSRTKNALRDYNRNVAAVRWCLHLTIQQNSSNNKAAGVTVPPSPTNRRHQPIQPLR